MGFVIHNTGFSGEVESFHPSGDCPENSAADFQLGMVAAVSLELN